MANILMQLSKRGLIYQVTFDQLLASSNLEMLKGTSVYCGFDPTASSLHIGHLPNMLLLHQLSSANLNIQPIAVVGGATGQIGDPSFRFNERNEMNLDQLEHNLSQIKQQIQGIFDRLNTKIKIIDNRRFYNSLTILDFLKETKALKMSYLINKEHVQERLQHGMTFAEFSYQTLQCYDFYRLFQEENCSTQIGGSDQWGNISIGVDFIKRKLNKQAFGITTKLLTTSSGEKIGKSAGNALFLDTKITNAFQFYQYCYNIPDQDVEHLTKMLTLIPESEIQLKNVEEREAQKNLGKWLINLIYGEQEFQKVQNASQAVYSDKLMQVLEKLTEQELTNLFSDIKKLTTKQKDEQIGNLSAEVIGISRSEIRRLIKQKGLVCNGKQIENYELQLSEFPALKGKYWIIRKGKKFLYLITLNQINQV